MTLDDLLYVTNESTLVILYENTEEIGRYDGKENIPEELNSRYVLDVYVWEKALCIEIEEEDA